MPTLPEENEQLKEAQHNSSPPAKVSTLTDFSDTYFGAETGCVHLGVCKIT